MIGQSRRKMGGHFIHRRQHAISCFQGIGPRLLVDQQGNCRELVQFGAGAVIARTQLDPSDVAQANLASIVAGFDHNLLELPGFGKAADSLHADFKRPLRLGGRSVQYPAGHLHIVAAQGVDDIGACEPEKCRALRVYPHPHGVLPETKRLDLADTPQSLEPVAHLQAHIVGDIQLIPTRIG